MQSLMREGIMNPEGALKALEFSQSWGLSAFSTPSGVASVTEKLKVCSVDMGTFLLNMAASLSMLCHLNWEKSNLWHSLVEACMLHSEGDTPSLIGEQYEVMLHGVARNHTKQSLSSSIVATPSLAIVLILRWLRTDALEYEPHLRKIIADRAPVNPSK